MRGAMVERRHNRQDRTSTQQGERKPKARDNSTGGIESWRRRMRYALYIVVVVAAVFAPTTHIYNGADSSKGKLAD